MKTQLTKQYDLSSLSFFFVLLIFFVPFSFSFQNKLTSFVFSKIILAIQHSFFKHALPVPDFSSDTVALNLLIVLLFILATTLFFICRLIKFDLVRYHGIFNLIIIYFLSFVLLKYGLNKVFKAQFYLPEPNILYSSFGNLSKDILFWSTMGTSRLYNLCTGTIEILIAILLFIRRTRTLGLVFSSLSFIQILIINISFDISVKTFSCMLLLMSLHLLYPNLKAIWYFFLGKQSSLLPSTGLSTKNYTVKLSLKLIFSCLCLIAVLRPYLATGNYNDDTQARPPLHGAYQVLSTNRPKNHHDDKYNKIFIHRDNFMIFQFKGSGIMLDYFFQIDTVQHQLQLFDYDQKIKIVKYDYLEKDSILNLQIDSVNYHCKTLNWRNLPAVKPSFHFTIDEM